MTRSLYVLLGLVAAAAAVLSFDALLGLAVLCGFRPALAWLLPVTVDAGAAAGSLVWLGGRAPAVARRFGRVLALALLGGSVAGNALGHGLDAYAARPAWWVVVAVSAVPPAVLGAVVHLAVLAGRRGSGPAPQHIDGGKPGAADPPRERVLTSEHPRPLGVRTTADPWRRAARRVRGAPAGDDAGETRPGAGDRAGELIAEGAGRRRIARELGVSEHVARELIAGRRNGEARR